MYGEKYWKARPKSELKVESKGKLEDDVDALYMLPLAEFTAARIHWPGD